MLLTNVVNNDCNFDMTHYIIELVELLFLLSHHYLTAKDSIFIVASNEISYHILFLYLWN